jgi:hypothetical protein
METYRSEQIHFTSNPKKGKPFGVRNTVIIEGSKAFKAHTEMDAQGHVMNTKKHRLTKKERKAIQNRRFVPLLWHCCRRTRKQR